MFSNRDIKRQKVIRDKELYCGIEQKSKNRSQTYKTLKYFAKNGQKIFKTEFIKNI